MSKRPRGRDQRMNPDPADAHIRQPEQSRDMAEQDSKNAAQPDAQPPKTQPKPRSKE